MQGNVQRLIFSFLLVLAGLSTTAQKDTALAPAAIPEVSFYYGKVLNIHPFFPETKSASLVEMVWKHRNRGRRIWHQYHKYPDLGVSLSYVSLGNKEVLGSGVAVVPFLNLHKGASRKISYDLRTGLGLAWFERPFDVFNNDENFVIGSQITAAVNVQLEFETQLSSTFSLRLKGGIWHYSNGHFNVPNIGANVVMFGAGLQYDLHPFRKSPESLKTQESYQVSQKDRLMFEFEYGLGWHEIEGTVLPVDGPLYSVHQAHFAVRKRKSYRSIWSLGLDVNYFNAFNDLIVNQELFSERETLRSFKGVLYLGHEYIVGNMGVEVRGGFNLYFPIRNRQIELGLLEDGFLHRRLSHQLVFKRYFTRSTANLSGKAYGGVGIKTIGGKADYVFLAVGANF